MDGRGEGVDEVVVIIITTAQPNYLFSSFTDNNNIILELIFTLAIGSYLSLFGWLGLGLGLVSSFLGW